MRDVETVVAFAWSNTHSGSHLIGRGVHANLDWSAWVTITIILASGIVAYRALHAAHKSRYGQLIMAVSARWDEADVIDSARLLRRQPVGALKELVDMLWTPEVEYRPPPYLDLWLRLTVYPNAIEVIGVLWSEKVLLERVIFKMWGAGIIDAWDLWEKAVVQLREHRGRPEIWRLFQEVALRMKEIEASKRPQTQLSSGV
jgi:hypothetical protein